MSNFSQSGLWPWCGFEQKDYYLYIVPCPRADGALAVTIVCFVFTKFHNRRFEKGFFKKGFPRRCLFMRLWAADDLWMHFRLTLIHLLDVLDEDGALESPPSLRWFCSVPLMTLGCLLLFSLEGAVTFVRRENQD